MHMYMSICEFVTHVKYAINMNARPDACVNASSVFAMYVCALISSVVTLYVYIYILYVNICVYVHVHPYIQMYTYNA